MCSDSFCSVHKNCNRKFSKHSLFLNTYLAWAASTLDDCVASLTCISTSLVTNYYAVHLHELYEVHCTCNVYNFLRKSGVIRLVLQLSLCTVCMLGQFRDTPDPTCVLYHITWPSTNQTIRSQLYTLVPRPSLAPVFDFLQYAETEREGFNDVSWVPTWEAVPDCYSWQTLQWLPSSVRSNLQFFDKMLQERVSRFFARCYPGSPWVSPWVSTYCYATWGTKQICLGTRYGVSSLVPRPSVRPSGSGNQTRCLSMLKHTSWRMNATRNKCQPRVNIVYSGTIATVQCLGSSTFLLV